MADSNGMNSVVHSRLREPDRPPGVRWWDKVPEVLLRIWKNRNRALRLVVICVAAGTAIAFLMPARYQSTTKIMPPDQQMGGGAILSTMLAKSGAGALAPMAGDLLGVKNNGALFVDLLRSRYIGDHLIDRFQLQHVYWKRYRQDAIAKLQSRTDVNEDRKSGVITITVTDADRDRAQRMAAAYVDELNNLVAQVSTSAARRERIFLQQRLAQANQDLESAERNFAQYASTNAAIDVKEQTKAMVQSAATLEADLIVARSELESVQQIYSPSNVRVRSVQARVNELENELNKMRGAGPSAPSSSVANADLYPSIRQLPVLGIQWADLYREVLIQEAVVELLTQQYEVAKVQEARELPSVKVIDAANRPEKKSFPPRLLLTAVFSVILLSACTLSLEAKRRWEALDEDNAWKALHFELRGKAYWNRNRTIPAPPFATEPAAEDNVEEFTKVHSTGA